MNTLEFVKDVPAEQLALIFKDYFEQHMFLVFPQQFYKEHLCKTEAYSLIP